MLRMIATTVLTLFLLGDGVADAARIKRLSGDPKPRLTAAQVRELEQKGSEKHPVEGYVSVETVVDCFDEMSYRYTGGRYRDEEIKFRLRQPNEIRPGKKYPLVVWFHGVGESDDDNKRQLAHVQNTIEFLAGPNSLDFYLMATQCPKDNRDWTTSISMDDGKGDAPMTIAREIMTAVIEGFPIDEDRISAFGLSSGGAAAWRFVMASPEQFASLVSCSASPPSGPLLPNVAVWAFGCTDDKSISIGQLREAIKRTREGGGSALLTEIGSAEHDSWNEALSQKKAVAWMIAQKRGSMLSPPPGAVLMPKTWTQAFWYFGLPLCCLLPLFMLRKRKAA